jgi:hypothetical protein
LPDQVPRSELPREGVLQEGNIAAMKNHLEFHYARLVRTTALGDLHSKQTKNTDVSSGYEQFSLERTHAHQGVCGYKKLIGRAECASAATNTIIDCRYEARKAQLQEREK